MNSDALYRAMYISIARNRFKIFECILEHIGKTHLENWKARQASLNILLSKKSTAPVSSVTPTIVLPPRSSTDPTSSAAPTNILPIGTMMASGDSEVKERKQRALDFLFANFKEIDYYFTDRDGQSLMHYVAKDGYKDSFKSLINKNRNPLFRDRLGRTAWDLASGLNEDFVYLDDYLRKAYGEDNKDKDKDKDKENNICIVELHGSEDPQSHKYRFSPKTIFSDDSTPSPLNSLQESIKQRKKVVWIQLDVNDVSDSATPITINI
jgi:hypothetical protein